MSLAALAVKNIFRNKFRTSLTILGGAVAIVAFIALRTVLWAWGVAAEFAAKDRIATRHKVSFVISMPKHYIDTIRAVPGVSAATYANWFGGKNPKDPDSFFASMAVDPPTFLSVYDEIVVPPDQKARWFEDRKGAIVGDVLARQLGVKVGDTITLQGTIFAGDWPFTIDGIYTASRKSMDRSQFLFHWDYLNQSIDARRQDQIGWIVSRIDNPERGAAISADIDKIFDEKDVQTATMSERAMNLSFMATLSAMLTALDIVSIIILLIMMMILGNTIAMGVRERTGEYGTLRAIGFSPRHIAFFVLGEGLSISLFAGIVGLALSYPIVELGMGRWLEENMGAWFPYFRISPVTMAVAVLLSLALGAIAALIPAYQASKLVVTDALRRIA